MRGSIGVAFVAFAALLWLVPSSAEAYLDPGTGSYVFQMVAAAVVSVGFVARAYWHRIRGFLARLGRPASDRPPDER
jgi:hypothetical protein